MSQPTNPQPKTTHNQTSSVQQTKADHHQQLHQNQNFTENQLNITKQIQDSQKISEKEGKQIFMGTGEHENQQIKQMQEIDGEEIPVETVVIDPDVELLKLYEQNMEEAQKIKGQATQYFKQQNFNDAILSYQESLHYTSEISFRSTVLSNIGICYIKNKEPSKAIKYCKLSLQQDQSNKKARMNLGRCYESEQKYEEALEQYKKIKVNEGTPLTAGDLNFIKEKVIFLEKKVNEINQKRKQEVLSGLKNIGNSVLGYFGMSLDNFKMEKGQNGGYNIQFKQ